MGSSINEAATVKYVLLTDVARDRFCLIPFKSTSPTETVIMKPFSLEELEEADVSVSHCSD